MRAIELPDPHPCPLHFVGEGNLMAEVSVNVHYFITSL
jgi:hypothetical protein